jgi:hypothetical protein
MKFILQTIIILCIIFFSGSFVKAQSAYRGGKGDGYASAKVEGININGGGSSATRIKIFPNPLINSALNISFPEIPEGKVKIMLVDVSGRICYLNELEIKNKKYPIQLPQIANGTYFILINTEKEAFKDKIIVIKE